MIKEMAVFGGFAHRSEAIEHQRNIEGDTILVSVLNGPTGFPVTPLCYFSVSKSLIEQFLQVLGSDFEVQAQVPKEDEINDPSGDFLRTAPQVVQVEKVEPEIIPEPPKEEIIEEAVEPEEVVVEKPAKRKVKKDEQSK